MRESLIGNFLINKAKHLTEKRKESFSPLISDNDNNSDYLSNKQTKTYDK